MSDLLRIKDGNILEILVDSESYNILLSENNKNAEKILNYSNSEYFNFIRSPFRSNFEKLNIIPPFTKIHNDDGNVRNILIGSSKQLFPYTMNYIIESGRKITNKKALKGFEFNSLFLAFIHSSLNNRFDPKTQILTTDNKFLLKNRLEIESYVHSYLKNKNHFNIVNLDETEEIMNLFLKYRNVYYTHADPKLQPYGINRGGWYWYSFRSKIPHYNVGALIDKPQLDAFATRFDYLLRSIDEIGIQYYSEVNNDTLDDTLYYFNYFIALTSGIFDALALTSKDILEITFRNDYHQKITLNPGIGDEFLKSINRNNIDLWNHINKNLDFIRLIYDLREVIIHREMPDKKPFTINGHVIHSIERDRSILNHFPKHKKNPSKIAKWGIYKHEFKNSIIINPFIFSKMALKTLIKFSDDYLKLLGFRNYVSKSKEENPHGTFINTIESFKEGCLDII